LSALCPDASAASQCPDLASAETRAQCRLATLESACGAYVAISHWYVDYGDTYVYDAATGSLVAVLANGIVPTTCTAGPDHFTMPVCQPAVLAPWCLADGATDVASSADGASRD
jgi:hypothetical protein